jgi:anti-sigma regulatory factor (Ser/Thr protein kinase)
MHVHQYLQMHIPDGIVADAPATRPVDQHRPEVCECPTDTPGFPSWGTPGRPRWGQSRGPSLGDLRGPRLGDFSDPSLGDPRGPSLGDPWDPSLKQGWRGGQEPPWAGLLEVLPPGTRPADALLPAARWVSRQIVPGQPGMGRAARAAREFTGQILRVWGLLVLVDDAAVIVSELVTNALRHGGGAVNGAAHEGVELILWRRSGQVVCAVTDPGTGTPVLVRPDLFGEAGRGPHVVQALSATWGWTRLDGSRKAVWATMGVPGGWRRPPIPPPVRLIHPGGSSPPGQAWSDGPARRSPISIRVQPARCLTELRGTGRVTCSRVRCAWVRSSSVC